MPEHLTAVPTRLALAAALCLATAACSSSAAGPGAPAAAQRAVTAAATAPATATSAPPTPEATATQPPTAGPTAAAIHLPPGFDADRQAWQDIDDALNQAAQDHQPVLIDFGASWCPGCAELDEAFKSPKVQTMVKPLHRVRIDTGPRKASVNLDIAAAYGLDLRKTGIPGLVLLSPQGTVEATTNDGLFDNDRPNSAAEIIGFLKPHL
ncbi:thioredoxin family protein [Kitasatospora sp. NPDC048540]|uniref:thioredoxin family protein n=1 Tax=Kitasatospora sp. NPDC048540 TaxID=3155634 RepID=UPI003403B559